VLAIPYKNFWTTPAGLPKATSTPSRRRCGITTSQQWVTELRLERIRMKIYPKKGIRPFISFSPIGGEKGLQLLRR
jgi:hypothetical protein